MTEPRWKERTLLLLAATPRPTPAAAQRHAPDLVAINGGLTLHLVAAAGGEEAIDAAVATFQAAGWMVMRPV